MPDINSVTKEMWEKAQSSLPVRCLICDYTFKNQSIFQWHAKNSKVHEQIEIFRLELVTKRQPYVEKLQQALESTSQIGSRLRDKKNKLKMFTEGRIATPEEALKQIGLNINILNEINTKCAFCNGKFAKPQKKYYHEECLKAFNPSYEPNSDEFNLTKQIEILERKYKKVLSHKEAVQVIYNAIYKKHTTLLNRKRKENIVKLKSELNNCPLLNKNFGKKLADFLNS